MDKKVVVITGASKGIGAATAKAFAKAGYNVVINYLSDDESAQKLLSDINDSNSIIVKADVFSEEGISELFNIVKDKYGNIDVLVCNAGLPKEPTLEDLGYNSILKSVSSNFISNVLFIKYFTPIINKNGCVLFTGSVYGANFCGDIDLPLFSAQKAAIVNFSQTMAQKFAPNIRFNVVAPGETRTALWDDIDPLVAKECMNMTLQKEWVEPSEIADAFVFLAKTPHINAQTITIDAGWSKKF